MVINNLVKVYTSCFYATEYTIVLRIQFFGRAFEGNQLTFLPTLMNNTQLTELDISNNLLSELPESLLHNNKLLWRFKANGNQLERVPKNMFSKLSKLGAIGLGYNKITKLHRDTFKDLADLQQLYLAGNRLTTMPRGVLRNNTRMIQLLFENNNLIDLPDDLLSGKMKMEIIGFARNKLRSLPEGFFDHTRKLTTLFLGMNNLQKVDVKIQTKLLFLMLHQNQLTFLNRSMINTFTSLWSLWGSYNNIEHIEDNTFINCESLKYILLNNNKLRTITNRTFYGARHLEIIFLSDNPIEQIADDAFHTNDKLQKVYLLQTKVKTIKMEWFLPNQNTYNFGSVTISPTKDPEAIIVKPHHWDMRAGFSSTGFDCGTYVYRRGYDLCTPCLSGSYIVYFIKDEKFKCVDCPAGGFYQDALAFYGERAYGNGCKMCDNGTFVSQARAPGRRHVDCLPCPEGTQNRLFAGFRACRCQDRFYRLHRFKRCYPCLDYGVTCFNESLVLDSGYYWQWTSESEKSLYIDFTNNLQIFDNSYDKKLVNFNGSFPKPYQCPRALSCRGGMDADCAEGYTGPLCAVCNEGHYKLVASCFKCPALHWLIFQICAIFLVVLLILVVVIKTRKRTSGTERSISDIILARVKIIVSFYQISAGTMDAFSYVQWPDSLTKLSEYAKFVQLNILQIAPLHCFDSRLKMNAYDNLVITCSLTVGVVLFTLLFYNLKRFYLNRNSKRYLTKKELNLILEETKEICYRNVFLFIFVTYPQTCSTIFQMLPPACHEICQDIDEKKCTFYLKKDYSVQCFNDKYNRYVILAYLACIYPFAVPILTTFVLWKYHFKTKIHVKEEVMDDAADQTQLGELKKRGSDQRKNCDQVQDSMKQKKSDQVDGEQNKRTVVSIDNIQQASNMTSTSDSNRIRHLEVIQQEQETQKEQQDLVVISRKERIFSTASKQGVASNKNSKRLSNSSLSKTVGAVFATKRVLQKSSSVDKGRRQSGRFVETTVPVVAAMSFIYENYTQDCWFWEILEMIRKLLMTSSLALIGAEGRTSLGVASLLSGLYAILHAHYMPIPDMFEHALQLTSLLVTFANTCIGMMLKIDQSVLLDDDAKIMDSGVITVLLVTANVMVTALVVVKYTVAIGRSIYSVYKNPRCSLTCCLSIMLTVDEVQSEARDMESKTSGWRMKTHIKREGLEIDDTGGDYGLTGVEMDNAEDSIDSGTTKEKEKEEDEEEERRRKKLKTTAVRTIIGKGLFKRNPTHDQ